MHAIMVQALTFPTHAVIQQVQNTRYSPEGSFGSYAASSRYSNAEELDEDIMDVIQSYHVLYRL